MNCSYNLRKEITIHYLKILAVIFCFLPLIPLWYFEYLPFQDYPNHFARLEIKANYENSVFFRENFRLIPFKGLLPPTYVTLDMFVLKLLAFIDTDSAMRVFISLYVILYVIAIYLLSAQRKSDFSLLLLVNLPFIYSAFFYLGFLNFLMSIPLFLLSIWAIERFEKNRSISNFFVVLFFIFWVYLTHIFTFSLLCIFLIFHFFVIDIKIANRIIIIAALSLFLIIILSVINIKIKSFNEPFLMKLIFLSAPFSHLSTKLLIITSTIFMAVFLIMFFDTTSYKRQYLYASIAFFLIYLILPFKKIGSFADTRALLISLILFTLSVNLKGKYAGILRLLTTVIFIINLSWLWFFCAEFNKNFSAQCVASIKPQSIVLPVAAIKSESSVVRPYLAAWGYFLRDIEILTPYLTTGYVLQIEYINKPPAPLESWVIHGDIEKGREMSDIIRNAYDYIIFIGSNAEAESIIKPFTDKICSESIVSLYKTNTKTNIQKSISNKRDFLSGDCYDEKE